MQLNFSKLEEEILNFWKENKIFKKSLKKARPAFVFFEGPPTANGRPGIHHILARSFKDVICRYKTMQGYYVPRKAGWDTHGLPVEIEVEKEIKTKSKKDIENFGIGKFNKKCKQSVWKYKKEWEDLTERIGFWLDMENPYITYEPEYMETLFWIMKKFWENGLLVEDRRVVPWCPRCQTSLSSHELAQGYKKVKDLSVITKFKIADKKFIDKYCDGRETFFLAWTTTPWSLPTTMALAIGGNYNYVVVRTKQEQIIFVKDRLDYIMKDFSKDEYEVVNELRGKEMEFISYIHPFYDFYRGHNEIKDNPKVYKTYITDYVSLEEGTGLVTINGAFGEIDMEAARKIGLPVIINVESDGTFSKEMGEFSGMKVKSVEDLDRTNIELIRYLAWQGALFRKEKHEHDYPFCWRCKSPLLYYLHSSWFLKTTKVKEKLIENNKKINWVPDYLKEGRFGNFLEEVRDWNFSRERYWGTPLPIWKCQIGKSQISNLKSQKLCNNIEVIGSREDIRKQKFSKNKYFILRHGLALTNTRGIVSALPGKKYSLTKIGKKKVKEAVLKLKKKLKGKKIDVIFSSDIERCKESAEIASKELDAKIIFAPKLREINIGIYEGKSLLNYTRNNPYAIERFEKKIEGGESWNGCKMRMVKSIEEIEKDLSGQGKNILLVSHGDPLWLLEGAMKGLFDDELFKERRRMIKQGELREIEFKKFPLDEEGEIDFHRPYIDEVKFYCPNCGGEMERTREVIDCWFDSGAMPFAQAHFPFTCAKSQISNLKSQNYKNLIKKIQFPADYICEAMDQTRGWFYTLLAVSTLLGFENPYKNVISVGIVLDKKGQKMSKSRGNVINPWEMIKKYGADSVRWYFFTINQPGEPKKFDENDIKKCFNKFILTLLNSYTFFETYKPISNLKSQISKPQRKTKNLLDRWILSRLQNLILFVSNSLNKFDVVSAARAIENFTSNDLSNWYIRRSRRRFQKPKDRKELKTASQNLGFILLELSKLTAPFIPFLSEKIYQEVQKVKRKAKNKKSVHLKNFPKMERKWINKDLEEMMQKTREIVALALAERKKAGIKVRQPLQKLKIKNEELKREKEILNLIKEEINVKEVLFDKSLKNEVELDTEITPELRGEGILREIIREVQEMRKKSGFKKENKVEILYKGDREIEKIIESNINILKEETISKEIAQRENPPYDCEKELTIDNKKIIFKIKD